MSANDCHGTRQSIMDRLHFSFSEFDEPATSSERLAMSRPWLDIWYGDGLI